MKKNVFFASLLCIITLFLTLTSCSDSQTKDKSFPDGSKILIISDYERAHLLFDDIAVVNEGLRSAQFYIARFDGTNLQRLSDRGFYVKYAFSDKGYIAFDNYNNELYVNTYCIFSVKTRSVSEFDSTTQLFQYAQDNDFTLGEWYYSEWELGTERTVMKKNDWSIVVNPIGFSGVRLGSEDMFAGKIDYFISGETDFLFHIKIVRDMTISLRAFDNPVLQFDDNKAIGKTFFTRQPIYYDMCIAVDTVNNSYKFLYDKDDVKNYLEEKNITADKQKVEYKE